MKLLVLGAILGGFAYEVFLRQLSLRGRTLIGIVSLYVVLVLTLWSAR